MEGILEFRFIFDFYFRMKKDYSSFFEGLGIIFFSLLFLFIPSLLSPSFKKICP